MLPSADRTPNRAVQPECPEYRWFLVTRDDSFTVINRIPTITTISPSSGSNKTSASITVTGTNYLPGCTASLVNRSTTIPGTISSFTATKFVGTFALSGFPAGLYNLTITNPGGSNGTKPNCFTVNPAGQNPLIVSYLPVSGVNTAALPFTITGSDFRTGMTVTIDNGTTTKTVSGTLTGSTQIKCSLPLKGLPIGVYNLTVQNTDGTFEFWPDAFTVTNPVPTISSITPLSGYNTSTVPVTITGTNYITGCTAILVNGSETISGTISAFTVTKFTGTFALAGHRAGIYTLTVTNPGGPNATKPFTVFSPGTDPTITGLTPVSGVNTAALPVHG